MFEFFEIFKKYIENLRNILIFFPFLTFVIFWPEIVGADRYKLYHSIKGGCLKLSGKNNFFDLSVKS